MFERNGVETIVHDDGILLLNEKHKEEGLHHKTLRKVTTKYNSNHRKHRYEIVDEPKKQFNRIFIDKKLAIKLIMDCRITSHYKFRTRLGFNQYDVILTKEQSVLTRIMSLFEGKKYANNIMF